MKFTYAFTPESFSSFSELSSLDRGHEILHFFVGRSPTITCVPSTDSARIQSALASSAEIDGDAGVDSPRNAAAMDALRIKIRGSSRYRFGHFGTNKCATTGTGTDADLILKSADLDSLSKEFVITAYQVIHLCRIHVLLGDNTMEAVEYTKCSS